MDGAMMEIGPYRVTGSDPPQLIYNNGSWDEFANLLFVDNPVGTGFSYVDTNSYLHELPEMADNMITFLEKWFDVFPEFAHDDVCFTCNTFQGNDADNRQIYIAGESYAGQHIPYIAQAIMDRNKDVGKTPWNLKGLLIGNGWISPVDQYLSYLPFAYKAGLIQADTDAAREVEAQQQKCIQRLDQGQKDSVETPECERVMTKILDVTKDKNADVNHTCFNMYDVRLRDDDSCGMNWPPDLEHVTPYLRRKDVVQALNINKDKQSGWTECNGAVGIQFRARNSKPAIQLLPGLLEQVPIVLFAGDQDMICNHLGVQDLINNMQWNGGKGFETSPGNWAPTRDWTFEGEPAGTYQEARNLTYIKFYNSSHMVPFDYPRRTRDMLDRFVNVDISSIGGEPADSRIDGEKAPLTSVGAHPNSTQAENEKENAAKEATWKAYYKSGEVVLVIVVIAAGVWGWYIWRDRRRRAGYRGVLGGEGGSGPGAGGRAARGPMRMGALESFRGGRERDLETADFDEAELDKLDHSGRANGAANGRYADRDREMGREHYDVGGDSEDEDEDGKMIGGEKRSNGHA